MGTPVGVSHRLNKHRTLLLLFNSCCDTFRQMPGPNITLLLLNHDRQEYDPDKEEHHTVRH